jgi:hypothetical protein
VQEFGDADGFWKSFADGVEHVHVEQDRMIVMLREQGCQHPAPGSLFRYHPHSVSRQLKVLVPCLLKNMQVHNARPTLLLECEFAVRRNHLALA